MMKRSISMITALALLAGICCYPREVAACMCRPHTTEERIARYEYVFRAYVSGAVTETNWIGNPTGFVVITIKEVIPYKGDLPPFTTLKTPRQSASCGLQITVPEFYWFFVDEAGIVNKCSGSWVADDEAFKELEGAVIDKILKYRKENGLPY